MVPFQLFQSVGGALLALIAVVVVGWFAIARIRNWMRSGAETQHPFTLEELRQLHREGQLSDEEYETARTAMISSVRKGAPLSAAEVKRRVQAGIVAKQGGSSPPTKPGDVIWRHPESSPDATSASDPDRTRRSAAPENGTQPPKSPKRPPQLG
jgi:hypothetical protein